MVDEGVTVRGEGADLRWGDLLRSGLDAHLDGRALSAAVELLEGDGAADEGELLLTGSELFCDAGAVRFGGWSGGGAGDGEACFLRYQWHRITYDPLNQILQ